MKFNLRKFRNFGIIAHIDAGKTTITERILFYTGKLHKTGEVHYGTAVMDWMPQEQERGITITSAATTTFWNRNENDLFKFNIIDTPGHVDFTVEVERSLRVLDGAIAVIDSNAGVESQTETVWKQADRYNIPRIIFCNKMDKIGANFNLSVNSLVSRLNIFPLIIQIPIGEENNFKGVIDLIEMKALVWDVDFKGINWRRINIPDEYFKKSIDLHEKLIETIIECDDKAIELYLKDKEFSTNQLRSLIRLGTLKNRFFPILCGTAFKNKCIQPLINAIVDYLPSPDDIIPIKGNEYLNISSVIRFCCNIQPTSMLVFKITNDIYVGNLSYVRLYSGYIKKGMILLNPRNGKKEKIIKILRMHANNRIDLNIAKTGEIVAITGLRSVITGDTLCNIELPVILSNIQFPVPVIQLAIEPIKKSDQGKLILILNKFLLEDPTLKLNIDKESNQIILSGMGELHLDIIVDRIFREYLLNVKIGKPQVAYRETITIKHTEEYVHKKQTGGAGQFAKVKIIFEPNNQGDEFVFISKIIGGSIPKEYISGVKKGIEAILVSGPIAGFPMIKIKATLIDGSYHEVDSSLLAFEIAAKQCFKNAIKSSGGQLLEPIMKIKILIPNEYSGAVIGDLNSRRGHILSQILINNYSTILSYVPLSNMFKYIDNLRSLSKGRGNYSMLFNHYSPIPKRIIEKLKVN